MAVEQSAVREGTRWDLRGRVVVVDEVTAKSVVFVEQFCLHSEVMKLDRFLEQAADPLRAEHSRLMDGLMHAMHDLPSDSSTGKTLKVLRDVAVYLLERIPPTVPAYVEPVVAPSPPPKPMPEPVVQCEAEAQQVEDYAIAMPDYDPPSVKKRRF